MNKLQLTSNVFSANTLGAGSLLPYNKPAVVFDFLDTTSAWIIVDEGATRRYEPGIPEIKNGGLTVDSNVADSRQWLATPFNTATDTITLQPGGNSTPATRAKYLSDLLQLARQANNYSTQSGEFRPVNICVNEPGDAGDRYSRVYDIQYAITGDMFSEDPLVKAQLTLTIIRYPYWTPIPLGTNPKWYTFLARDLAPEDFLVPSELALFPDDIGSYTIAAGGGFSIATEGYTPDIGYGDTVIDFVTGVGITGAVRVGNTGSPIAPVVSGNSYILSFWVRSESSSYDAVNMQVRIHRSSDGTLLFSSANFNVTVASGWVKLSYTVTATDSSGLYFFMAKNTSATDVSMDIYGISVKLASNPLDLTDYGNANPLLQNWFEGTFNNFWTREDPANLRLNYIDLDAEDIPGDAPALLCSSIDLNISTGSTPIRGLIMGRRLDMLPDEAIFANTFMAENSALSSPTGLTTTYQADASRGISSSPQGNATNNYTIQIVTGAGAISEGVVAQWVLTSYAQGGKVAVFMRGDYTAGTPSEAQFYIRVVNPFFSGSGDFQVQTQPRALVNVTTVAVNYMGLLDLTQIKNAPRNVQGVGVGATNYLLQLVFSARSAGSAATYRVTDIILMPYDEIMTTSPTAGFGINSNVPQWMFMDNTGYFNQTSDGTAFRYRNLISAGFYPDVYRVEETQGQLITLEPNRNNRLYFLIGDSADPPVSPITTGSNPYRIRLNIIPQWRRLRAV